MKNNNINNSFYDNKEINNYIGIRYKVDKSNCESIKIFGEKFVENNKDNFKIVYQDD